MGTNDTVALLGIGVTLVVSSANLAYNLWSGKHTLFVNTVTASRLKWIGSLRDGVSEYMATISLLMCPDHCSDSNKVADLMLKRDTLLHQIVLHLNPLDAEDLKIKSVADRLRGLTVRTGTPKEFQPVLLELRDATAAYLKKEWNRVKSESGARNL
jgi:hypothetical protein